MVLNTAFYPTLMWNSRFHARSGDPFDNSLGFVFPDPEGLSLSY
jgi:cytochrome c peroxidase